MSSIPQRTSLVSQTRAVLIEGMQAGRWRESLPGQRRLCEELRISRWTLGSALNGLSQDGLIEICHGCACKIMPRARRTRVPPNRPLRVALLVPQPLAQLRQFVLLWVDDLRLILGDQGIGLTVIDHIRAYQPEPAAVLRRLVDEKPHDVWVLMLSTLQAQIWFEQNEVPSIVTGACGDGVALPALDPDHHAAGVHAAHVLLGLGHRRIAYVRPRSLTAGVAATEGGLRAGLAQATRPAPQLIILLGNSREEIKQTMERSLDGARPTAFVFAKAFAALTGLTWLTSRGFHVPKDISVMSVEPEPIFEQLVPTMAYYTLSPANYAKRMAKLVIQRLNGTAAHKTQYLDMTYVRGESVGASALNRI